MLTCLTHCGLLEELRLEQSVRLSLQQWYFVMYNLW